MNVIVMVAVDKFGGFHNALMLEPYCFSRMKGIENKTT